MTCWLLGHDPLRERQDADTVRWVCYRCSRVVGVSAYPASPGFARRRKVAQMKAEFWTRQAQRKRA